MGPAVAIVTFVVLVETGVVWWAVRRRGACSPIGIAHRLGRPDARHVVRLRGYRATWNPAKPLGPLNALFGPGVATYWKDAEFVHLKWQPRSGPTQQLAGPLPAIAIEGTPAYVARRRILRSALLVLVGYGVIVVVGGAAGYVVSTGATSARLTGLAIGGGGTFLIVQVLFQAWRVVRGVRRRDARAPVVALPVPENRDAD